MPRQFTAPAAFSDKPYTPIPMTPVASNQVACIGYDAGTKTLACQFSRGSGHIYHYPNVEPTTFDAFMAAESKGGFFKENIKPLAFEKFAAPEADLDAKPNPGAGEAATA